MRKTGKRRMNYGLKPQAPMLVTRSLVNTNLELKERAAVNAFSMGYATKEHFFLLQDMVNLLLIAGQSSDTRQYAIDYVEAKIKPIMLSIEERQKRTGKLGVTAQEMLLLREFVDFNKAFWLRQPTELFAVCHAETKAFYQDLNRERAAA